MDPTPKPEHYIESTLLQMPKTRYRKFMFCSRYNLGVCTTPYILLASLLLRGSSEGYRDRFSTGSTMDI